MDREYDHPILDIHEDIDNNHPAPRPEKKSQACPPAFQLRAEKWKALEVAKRTPKPLPRILRKAVCPDQRLEILDRALRQLDTSHALEIVERDGPAGPGFLEPLLSPLERPWD
jgi:hypothetical protein